MSVTNQTDGSPASEMVSLIKAPAAKLDTPTSISSIYLHGARNQGSLTVLWHSNVYCENILKTKNF